MADHITHLRLVSIPVADVDRAKAFYVDVLGFEERFDGPFGEGMRWVELAPPGSQATIALVTWFDQMPPGSVTGLVLDTPDAQRRLRGAAASAASSSPARCARTRGARRRRSSTPTATAGC